MMKKKQGEENGEETKEIEEIELQENDIPMKEEDSLSIFAKKIEWKLENLEDDLRYINITNYTSMEIEGIRLHIFVGKERNKDTYTYHITIANSLIISNDETLSDRDIYIYRKNNFEDILSVLEDIEKVKTNYKWMEHELISPKEMEYAKIQRTYFPISSDKNCSVCYNPTNQYTVCKHPICFRCRYHCIVSNNLICPICRKEELKLFPSELE